MLVALDDSTWRGLGRAIDADRLERGRIEPERVAIPTFQSRVPLADDCIQIGGYGQSSPAVSVPPATTQPRPGRQALGRRAQHRQPVFERGRRVQVDLLPSQRETAKVDVGVDEPGHDGPPTQIENPRAGSLELVQAGVAAGQDLALRRWPESVPGAAPGPAS